MAAPRRINLHSVLGPDQLMIKDATVREELGRMSVMDLDLLRPDEDLALDDLLGRGFSVELVLDGDKSRFFHGIVAECSQIGRVGRYARYSAKVVPWVWFLTRTSDRAAPSRWLPTSPAWIISMSWAYWVRNSALPSSLNMTSISRCSGKYGMASQNVDNVASSRSVAALDWDFTSTAGSSAARTAPP